MTKNVQVLFVISQAYSHGFCQAVFPNLTCSLQLHVKTNKTYCMRTEKLKAVHLDASILQ